MRFSTRIRVAMTASLAAVAIGAPLTSALPAHAATAPPPAGGYFQLVPHGGFAALPSDATAASRVKRSAWEPRPQNTTANTAAPVTSRPVPGYGGMEHGAALFGRVTGAFTGTTDETIQWAAVKWGLPDDVVRAQAVTESSWYQNHKIGGMPVRDHGYGDYGQCGGSPAASGYGSSGPASFGIMQIKHCMNPGTAGSSETSTAFNLDYYGAIIRGCIEGWDSWLGRGYAAGDLWGCVGRWYSGDWYGAGAVAYIATVKTHLSTRPWRAWPSSDVTSRPPTSPAPTRATTPAPKPVITTTPTAPAVRRGLAATYFSRLGFQGRQVHRVDPQVDFAWKTGSPTNGIAHEQFSARWRGVLTPRVTGYYTFSTRSDDGVRLVLDGRRIIDAWSSHPVRTDTSGRVHLSAGRRYQLRLEYYERTGAATVRLLWAGPGWRTTVVPSGVLTPSP